MVVEDGVTVEVGGDSRMFKSENHGWMDGWMASPTYIHAYVNGPSHPAPQKTKHSTKGGASRFRRFWLVGGLWRWLLDTSWKEWTGHCLDVHRMNADTRRQARPLRACVRSFIYFLAGGGRAGPALRRRLLAWCVPSFPTSMNCCIPTPTHYHRHHHHPSIHPSTNPPTNLGWAGTMVWPVSLWTAEYIHRAYRHQMPGATFLELGCGWCVGVCFI